jgi:hypothetical protein
MARLIITGMPHPPENELWYAICVSLFKGEVFADDKVKERVKEGLADESREVVVIGVDTKAFAKQVELAFSWGTHPLTGPAVLPLCASHFPAVDPNGGPQIPPTGQNPLYRGLS